MQSDTGNPKLINQVTDLFSLNDSIVSCRATFRSWILVLFPIFRPSRWNDHSSFPCLISWISHVPYTDESSGRSMDELQGLLSWSARWNIFTDSFVYWPMVASESQREFTWESAPEWILLKWNPRKIDGPWNFMLVILRGVMIHGESLMLIKYWTSVGILQTNSLHTYKYDILNRRPCKTFLDRSNITSVLKVKTKSISLANRIIFESWGMNDIIWRV